MTKQIACSYIFYFETEYNTVRKKQCSNVKYGSFTTWNDAKRACNDDGNCEAIHDNVCDTDDDGGFSLCPVWFEAQSSTDSCVSWKDYDKGKKIKDFGR